MPKKPKCEDNDETKGNWAEDQKEREYYYDDSHGYEKYTPDDGEEDDKDTEERTKDARTG